MRRLLAVLLSAAVLTGLGTAPAPAEPPTWPTLGEPPLGANDWSCRPTAERPSPVVIVHGTFGDQKSLLDRLSLALVSAGFCVYSFDYGNRATASIEQSAEELKAFTGQVLQTTGAAKVSMVGHSQGGMMPRYYIKFLGGDAVVDDLVGLAPSNHGTRITGDPDNPLTGPMMTEYCPACQQQAAGSGFLAGLNAGDETPGDVSYTSLTTRYDTVVVPHTSGYLAAGPLTTNLTLQDVCAVDTAEHLQIPLSGTAIGVTLDALTGVGPADPAYTGCG